MIQDSNGIISGDEFEAILGEPSFMQMVSTMDVEPDSEISSRTWGLFWNQIEQNIGIDNCFDLVDNFARSEVVNSIDGQLVEIEETKQRYHLQTRMADFFTCMARDQNSRASVMDLQRVWGPLGDSLLVAMDTDRDGVISLNEWVGFWDSAIARIGVDMCTQHANLLQAKLQQNCPLSPLWQPDNEAKTSRVNQELCR